MPAITLMAEDAFLMREWIMNKKKDSEPRWNLTREEEDRFVRNLGEALSRILSRKYDCKITRTYTRKEEA